MKKKFTTTLMLVFVAICVHGQDITSNLTRKAADLLLKSLEHKTGDTSRINCLLKLARFNILKPGENKADLDSAASFTAKAKELNAKIKNKESDGYITLVESSYYKEKGDRKKGKDMVEKAILILKQIRNNSHLGDAYMELSPYYDYSVQAQLNKKIKIVELAVAAFKAEGKTQKLGYSLQMLADLYSTNDEQQKALEAIKLSLLKFQAVNYKALQGVYIIHSSIYSLLSDYKQALKFGLMALKTAESQKDTTMQLCEINNIVAVILGKLGEKENAIAYYKNALQIAERYNDRPGILLIVSNIVYTSIRIGKYQSALQFMKSIPLKYLESGNPAFEAVVSNVYCFIYLSLKQYNAARPYAENLLSILSLHSNVIADLDNTYVILIQYFTATKQYGFARTFLHKSRDFIESSGSESPIKIERNYKLWFKLDSTEGNYRSAINDLSSFHRIKDSLFNETESKQFKQLEVQYETEKKENQLKLKDQHIGFLLQKNQLQQSKLEHANLLRNVTIAGILALFIIIFSLFRQYVLRQQSNLIVRRNNVVITKKNELLQHLLKEKEWLIKEVHHRVKNNLHTVICLLESQAAYLENDALKAIENSQHRIYAMSLIHQKLYQSDDVKTIDMSLYLPEFIRYLSESFDTKRSIRFQLDIEPLMLGVSQAIPLALIINEAVTNAIKYAFSEKTFGIIEIGMHQNGEYITLSIADNGIGIDDSITNAASNSLGLKLMKGLSEDINAGIKFANDNGTKITIVFEIDPLNVGGSFLTTLTQTEVLM
jgi:two-component sensor histidine kinase